MVHQVEYNGQMHEFPDEATPEMMAQALGIGTQESEQSIQQPAEQKPPTSLGDIFRRKKGPEGQEAGNQLRALGPYLENPATWANVGIGGVKGLGNTPSALLNLPIMAQNFLDKTNIPTVPYPFHAQNEAQEAGEYLSPGVPWLKGAKGIRNIAREFPGLVKGAKETISKATGKHLPELEKQLSQSEEAHKLAEAQQEKAQGHAAIENVPSTEGGARIAQHKIQNELEGFEQPEVSTLPIQSSRESDANLERSKISHENAANNLAQTEKEISQHLNKGKAHGLRVGRYIKKEVEDTEKNLKGDYGKFAKEMSDRPVEMPQIEKVETDNPVLRHLYEIAPNASDAAGEKALIKYKDFRNERFKLKQRMKTAKSAQEADDISKALSATQSIENKSKAALVKSFGNDFLKLNKRYSNFYDLRGNSTVKSAMKHGKLKGNLIEKLSGSEKGQDLLRDIVHKDPEMIKNVLGKQFSKIKKIPELHEADELAQEYIDKMPELQDLLVKHHQAKSAAELAKNALSRAEKTHKNVISAEKTAHQTISEQQKAVSEAAEKRKGLEAQLEKHNKHLKELEEAAKNEKQTLESKVKIENQIKKTKEDIKEARWKIGKIATYGGIGWAVQHYGNIGRLFGSNG